MQKKRAAFLFVSVLVLCSSLILLFFYSSRKSCPSSVTAAINQKVLRQHKNLPPPNIRGAPVAARQIQVQPKNKSPEPTLSRDELRQMRITYNRTRFDASLNAEDDSKSIQLAKTTLRVSENNSVPDFHAAPQTMTQRNTKPFIVYTGKPITESTRQRLIKDGAILRGYLPNFAFLTELTAPALDNLKNNEEISFIAEYKSDYKIDPFLKAVATVKDNKESLYVSIQTFDPQDIDDICNTVRNQGGNIETVNRLPQWGLIKAIVALQELPQLATLGEIQWIEEYVPAGLLHDYAARSEHLNAVAAWNNWHLSGENQILGHGDTGIDTGNPATIKADFQGQIAAIFDLANGGSDASDTDGHGTHTAGTLCGNGILSGGQYKSIAYNAKLVSQCLVNKSTGGFTGINDLYGMYMQSYMAGATIHSDSWGADYYGEYDSMARITDLFTWSYKDFLPVFAAGNSGTDINNNGVVDLDCITSPGTAKNVLTVGASESDRPFAMEGYLAATYSQKWSTTYKTNPIKSDYISRSAATNPYLQGMAAFSSRGPTDDQRIKPEIVAPGTDIISTRSTATGAGYLWGILPSNLAYCYGGGTSMATPLIASSSALIREYLVKRAGIENPSAALIKATAIGGGKTLAPGQYGTSATQEIPFTRPNNVEGWGQLDIEHAVHPAGMMVKVIDNITLQTGQTNTFEITVEKSDYPLDVILCWSDYPGTAGAAVNLINNLDLVMTDPDSNILYPNNLATNDTRNTVESILINSATPGTYTISIIGYNIPVNGGQAALYIRGAFEEQPLIVHQATPYFDAFSAPYPIDFKIQSLHSLTNNEVMLHYNTGTSLGVTGLWHTVSAQWSSNADYQALIPQKPADTTLYYYLSLSNELYQLTLPQNALSSAEFFRMHLGTPTELIVDGQPEQYGTVAPAYGTNLLLSGELFTAEALPENLSATERFAASGWSGTGDIPATGHSSSLTLSLHQDSTINWQWQKQFALNRKLYFREIGYNISDGTSWHWQDIPVAAQSTPDILRIISPYYDELYVFYGWSLNNARWPDDTAPSINPFAGLVMDKTYTLQANYMEFATDNDSDSLYDWWELRFLGSTESNNNAEDDLDQDGWNNLLESLDNTNPLNPQDYPTPPGITVHPLAPFQQERAPWLVEAQITDNFLIFNALLEWKEKGDLTWRQMPMNFGTNGLFNAIIDPPSHGAVRVDYRVIAYDIIGYYDPSFASVSPVYSVIGDYDTPWLEVSSEHDAIVEVALQSTNLIWNIANLAGADLVWSSRLATVSQIFETTNAGWNHSGTNDLWNVTTHRTWNGEPVWYCGNTNTYRYADMCHASLDTPAFTVEADTVLLFRHWMKFEKYGIEKPAHYWDGAVIMISTNNGAHFSSIEPINGYNALIEANPDSPFPADTPALADNGNGWQTTMIDLAEFVGQTVIIRFEFGSDRYTFDEGWYIADVSLLTPEAALPSWLTLIGDWYGVLPDLWSTDIQIAIDPTQMQTNSEHTLCLQVKSNDPDESPMRDVTIRRGFAVSAQSTGNGSILIDDPIIFRTESAVVYIQADYGSFITNISINGVMQPGDYDFTDISRSYNLNPVTNNLTFNVDFALRTWNLKIASVHGTPLPANGTYSFTHGDIINAAVNSLVYDTNPDIRYSINGFALEGTVPTSYTASEVVFTLTNHAELAWLWCTNYQMHALSTGHGVVVPPSGWYVAGTTACTTSYPALYYHFSHWDGDIFDATMIDNEITMPMNTPRTIYANFSANLTSTHGVPEYWLAAQGFQGDFETAAESDQDNDGMPTWKEWRSDTDPNENASLLQLKPLIFNDEWLYIEWIGGVMRTQMLQSAVTPAGPWVDRCTNLPPTSVTNSITLPRTEESLFFRIAIP